MKKKLILLSSVAVLSLSLLLTACGNKGNNSNVNQESVNQEEQVNNNHNHNHDHEHEEKDLADVSLSDWEGKWNNFTAYFDKEEFQPILQEEAEEHGETVEEVKAEFTSNRIADFNSMIVEGDKISFYEKMIDESPEEISSATYKLTGVEEADHGGHHMQWFIFESEDDSAKYPILLLMDIHGEEGMAHFHLRYGSSVEECLQKGDWYPTFIASDTPLELVEEELHHDHDHDH